MKPRAWNNISANWANLFHPQPTAEHTNPMHGDPLLHDSHDGWKEATLSSSSFYYDIVLYWANWAKVIDSIPREHTNRSITHWMHYNPNWMKNVCESVHIFVYSATVSACKVPCVFVRCRAQEPRHMRERSVWVGKHMWLAGLGSGKPHLFITEIFL